MRFLKHILFDTFSSIVHIKTPENADGNDSIRRFFRLRFHLSTLETEGFQNVAFSKGSSFETVFESRFSVDERRKRKSIK